LDELIIAGELQESSKKSVLRVVCQLFLSIVPTPDYCMDEQVTQSDTVEEQENAEDTMARIGSRSG